MATKDRQKFISSIVGKVLNEEPQIKKFDWFINKHKQEHFREHFNVINNIFNTLNGDFQLNQNKKTSSLECDAYFGGNYNFMFEFDEYQHFSSFRLNTFNFYPSRLPLNYNVESWKSFCNQHSNRADKYRRNKITVDFNFQGGRTAQRAYLDCFRDLLPAQYGLNPTLRISEFEVANIYINDIASFKKIEALLKSKLK